MFLSRLRQAKKVCEYGTLFWPSFAQPKAYKKQAQLILSKPCCQCPRKINQFFLEME